ncbi:hypothetical protein P4195_29835 [Bacillus thuringiensis]|uniref:hypothetical protein n=1 Tax=Bacillus cereus TaxID=1396 RepID=UPI002DB98383|nr:hypothetical protein [Bacillus cereus]MED2684051.1 hypothetical protein [Bacillus thuringiensis]
MFDLKNYNFDFVSVLVNKSNYYSLMASIVQKMLASDDENERINGMKIKEILEREGYYFGDYKPTVM